MFKKNLLPLREFHSPKKVFMELTPIQSRLVSEFNQRIKDGFIELELVPCMCGSTAFDLVASVDRYSILQKTVMCTKCGLIQSNPRIRENQYVDFYSSDLYRLCYEGENYIDISKKRYTLSYAEHIFKEVNKIRKIDSNCSVLDFGAGGGWNLLPFVNVGAKAIGVEYSQNLVKLGRQFGLNMIQGGIENIEGLFDIIILSHVAEHFSAFKQSLKKISTHLKKNGLFYIEVPNILNFGMAQLQNAHTYYFTPQTFQYYCSEVGLRLLKIGEAQRIHMFGIFDLSDNVRPIKLEKHHRIMRQFFWKKKLRYIVKTMLINLKLYKNR